jgi:hypothetical protein
MHNNANCYLDNRLGKSIGVVIQILCLFIITQPTASSIVSMNISTINQLVGSTTSVAISLDRTKNRDGSTIVPTTITTSLYIIVVSFDRNYVITNGVTTVAQFSNFTINSADRVVTFVYNSTLFGPNIINFTINGVKNPLVSSVALTTYVKINDNNNALRDESYNSLTYNAANFKVSDINWSFNPANVSTISNLTLLIYSNLFNSNLGMFM